LGGVGTLLQKGSDPPEARLGGGFRASKTLETNLGKWYNEILKEMQRGCLNLGFSNPGGTDIRQDKDQ
jgi:hypothetical protein